MPRPLTSVPFSAAPYWLAVRSSLLAWVGKKMQPIFWRGCPLQVLHRIVSFVQVLVVDNAVVYWWWWSEECCRHQAMHPDCLPDWVWANWSNVVATFCEAPFGYHASGWCDATEGTYRPSRNLQTWCRIKHRLPLLTRRRLSKFIFKSEFNSFDGGSVVATSWHCAWVKPGLLRCWTDGFARLPFICSLHPPLHWFALRNARISSLQVCVRMGYILTSACIL